MEIKQYIIYSQSRLLVMGKKKNLLHIKILSSTSSHMYISFHHINTCTHTHTANTIARLNSNLLTLLHTCTCGNSLRTFSSAYIRTSNPLQSRTSLVNSPTTLFFLLITYQNLNTELLFQQFPTAIPGILWKRYPSNNSTGMLLTTSTACCPHFTPSHHLGHFITYRQLPHNLPTNTKHSNTKHSNTKH